MKNKIISILRDILPSGKVELILFSVLFVLYAFLSVYIALETNITDQTYPMKTDAYFSLDNAIISHHGLSIDATHPFCFLFMDPLLYIGIIFSFIFGVKGKAFFLVLICSLLVTLSNVYIYRILDSIISLKKNISLIISVMYAFMSTCIILSFTFESYTFSIFSLSYVVYFYSKYIKEDRAVPLRKSIVLAFGLGGITITNLVKGIIPLFFTSKKHTTFLKQGLFIGIVFISSVLIVTKFNFFSQLLSRTSYVEDSESFAYIIFTFFWSVSIIFLPIEGHVYDTVPLMKIIIFGEGNTYYMYAYYVLSSLFLLAVIYSIIINFRNKQVQLLLSLWIVDIIIHVIFKYGLISLFIYGGHWVFIVPLLLGWGYKASGKKCQKFLLFFYSVLAICLLINNGYWMVRFVQIAKELYPA